MNPTRLLLGVALGAAAYVAVATLAGAANARTLERATSGLAATVDAALVGLDPVAVNRMHDEARRITRHAATLTPADRIGRAIVEGGR